MAQYINKDALVAMIRKRLLPVIRDKHYDEFEEGKDSERIAILDIIDTLEVKEVDLELEIDNNSPKITIGTKIRSKTNPNVILSIISDDCHEDEFECSNGSVLSLKQIEKDYDLII